MKIVLIRHGESEANRLSLKPEGFLCGRWDCELTEKGLEQALSLRGNPSIAEAEAFFCSPLKRTLQTIAAFTDNEYIVDNRIQERTMGDFDGHTVSELFDNPIYFKYFHGDQTDFRASFITSAPKGENYSDVEKRVGSFLEGLKKKDYNKVVIVSHYVAIRCMIKIINGLSEEDTLKLRVHQCEPIELVL